MIPFAEGLTMHSGLLWLLLSYIIITSAKTETSHSAGFLCTEPDVIFTTQR